MKRFLELDVTVQMRTWPGYEELLVEFGDIDVQQFCCELALVLYGQVKSLTMKTQGANNWVRLACHEEDDDRRLEIRSTDPGFDVTLGWRHLARWLNFFLKYYRDGMAEVNHFHIEQEGGNLELTIAMQDFQPPMPSEEARKILGTDE
ncbi:MAG: hypothetical protein ACQEVA_01290 [Myxococcota bacterium]